MKVWIDDEHGQLVVTRWKWFGRARSEDRQPLAEGSAEREEQIRRILEQLRR